MRTNAALLRAPGRPLELAKVELAEPGSHDVVVRMAAVGICGSDLHVVKGEWPRPTPMILGHEGSGVVELVGTGVEAVRPGDRVVVSWAPWCGECGACRAGRRTACTALRDAIGKGTMLDGKTGISVNGEPVYRMTTIGALAEHVLVPETAVLPLADGVSLEHGALLGCAALTGVGAVLSSDRVGPGSSVAVIGAGGVGQFVVQGARMLGATTIVAVDPLAGRRDQALRLGATAAVAPEDAAIAVGDGADAAFEAVGSAETAALALALTRPAGFACLIGMPAAGVRLDLDPFEFVNREKTLTGSVYGSKDPAEALPGLLERVAAGEIELAPVLGPSYPLARVNEAIDASLAGSPGRVLVTMP